MQVEMVTAFASLFVHRWDSYAIQQRNGSYWRESEPLTLPIIESHLRGLWTLGTYVLDTSSCCTFAVLDADQNDGLMVLAVIANDLALQGVPTLLEESRRGGHLWIHFAAPTPAAIVRAWLSPYADDGGLELYPKQDVLTLGGWGSLIRVPLGIHRRSRGWYPFLQVTPEYEMVPVADTIEANCQWVIQHIERVMVPETRVMSAPLTTVEAAPPVPGLATAPAHRNRDENTGGIIRSWCRAQDIMAVIGQYVALDARGVGSCPFKTHHHRGDLRPSFQVFGGDNPHWYCYTWRRAGDLFDFLCLYHGLTPQEGWQWLQEGWFDR